MGVFNTALIKQDGVFKIEFYPTIGFSSVGLSTIEVSKAAEERKKSRIVVNIKDSDHVIMFCEIAQDFNKIKGEHVFFAAQENARYSIPPDYVYIKEEYWYRKMDNCIEYNYDGRYGSGFVYYPPLAEVHPKHYPEITSMEKFMEIRGNAIEELYNPFLWQENKKNNRVTENDFKEAFEKISQIKPVGASHINVTTSGFIKKGQPWLLMHPDDYEVYSKKLKDGTQQS